MLSPVPTNVLVTHDLEFALLCPRPTTFHLEQLATMFLFFSKILLRTLHLKAIRLLMPNKVKIKGKSSILRIIDVLEIIRSKNYSLVKEILGKHCMLYMLECL